MRYPEKPRGKLTEGWALTDGLVKNPYISRWSDTEKALCAEFKRMVFEDGVPIKPSTAHNPDYLALTELELRNTAAGNRATIMGVSHALRQAAFDQFPELTNPKPAPSHVIEPVEPQVYFIYTPRQMAAEQRPNQKLQMKG